MKRKILTLLLAMLLVPLCGYAQLKVTTKKVKLADFTAKTTKVVLTGNDLLDATLKDECSRRWRISPYEFCSLQEYQGIQKSQDFYFLRIVDIEDLTFLDLSKEGLQVADLPLCAAQAPSGRELVFLGAYLDILQDFVLQSMTSDRVGYVGLKHYSQRIFHSSERPIYIAREDFSGESFPDWEGKGISFCSVDEADGLMTEGSSNAIVGYAVFPEDYTGRKDCYVLLISADTHELFYYDKHKVARANAGFTKSDLRIIAGARKAR